MDDVFFLQHKMQPGHQTLVEQELIETLFPDVLLEIRGCRNVSEVCKSLFNHAVSSHL